MSFNIKNRKYISKTMKRSDIVSDEDLNLMCRAYTTDTQSTPDVTRKTKCTGSTADKQSTPEGTRRTIYAGQKAYNQNKPEVTKTKLPGCQNTPEVHRKTKRIWNFKTSKSNTSLSRLALQKIPSNDKIIPSVFEVSYFHAIGMQTSKIVEYRYRNVMTYICGDILLIHTTISLSETLSNNVIC